MVYLSKIVANPGKTAYALNMDTSGLGGLIRKGLVQPERVPLDSHPWQKIIWRPTPEGIKHLKENKNES
jgi:hypothetical protein